MLKLILLLAVAAALTLNTIAVERDTRAAVARDGGRVLRLAGPDLNVKVEGRGPAVVLIHGFGSSIAWWNAVTPGLARDHRVIRVDLVGHGGSEAPAEGYSMRQQARAVARALDRLGVRRAAVVGHSMGGTVATALAEAEPRLIDRVAVIDTSPSTASGYDSDLGFAAKLYLTPVVGHLLARVRPESAVRDGVARAFAEDFDYPKRFVEDVKRLTYPAFTGSRDGSNDYREARALDRRLARTGKPVLALWGPRDRIAPVRGLERYRRIRGARARTVPGAGHTPMVERPGVTLRLLRAFLAS